MGGGPRTEAAPSLTIAPPRSGRPPRGSVALARRPGSGRTCRAHVPRAHRGSARSQSAGGRGARPAPPGRVASRSASPPAAPGRARLPGRRPHARGRRGLADSRRVRRRSRAAGRPTGPRNFPKWRERREGPPAARAFVAPASTPAPGPLACGRRRRRASPAPPAPRPLTATPPPPPGLMEAETPLASQSPPRSRARPAADTYSPLGSSPHEAGSVAAVAAASSHHRQPPIAPSPPPRPPPRSFRPRRGVTSRLRTAPPPD